MGSTSSERYLLERDADVASVGSLGERKGLPKFDYHLDEHDPDVVVLRRQDGAFVSAFSAQGATREGILEAAKEDYAKLVEEFSSIVDPQDIVDPQEDDAQTRTRTS
jgi:hypothetical protein